MPLIGKATRERLVNKFQDEFSERARRIAERLNEKGFRTRQGHAQAKRLIREHTLTQAMLGVGRPLTLKEIARIEKIINAEEKKLQRFMDKVSIRRVQRNPMSVDAIASRLEMYSGVGRAEYYKASELVDSDDDTVELYSAKDDNNTCTPCLENHGKYFLPGQGPFPGEVCKGRGRCRCRRIPEQNKRLAKRLRAQE